MCIGDSNLAGWNAAGYRTMEFSYADAEFRGASFGCGDGRLLGLRPIDTLAVILRQWRPDLQGMSTGWTPKYATLAKFPLQCGFNAASSGATIVHLYNQAVDIVGRVNNTPLVHEWKVLTMQPGWGELAWETGATVTIFTNWLYATLALLKAGLGKTYVNLLAVSEKGDQFAVNQPGSVCASPPCQVTLAAQTRLCIRCCSDAEYTNLARTGHAKFGMWKKWQKWAHNATFKTGSTEQLSVRWPAWMR
jgi:hypothetical protein